MTAMVVLLASSLRIEAVAEVTVEDNVLKILRFLKIDHCVDIYERYDSYVIAKPVGNPGGGVKNCLLETILESRKLNKGEWVHDNVVLSRLQKNGRHSYRQTSRPSLQVIFNIKKGVVIDIILDVDKYPPHADDPKGSIRHAILELIPHWVLRTKTNSEKMSFSIDKLQAH